MDDGERLYSKKIFCSVHYARLTGQNNQHNELSEYFERKGSELKKKKNHVLIQVCFVIGNDYIWKVGWRYNTHHYHSSFSGIYSSSFTSVGNLGWGKLLSCPFHLKMKTLF